MRWYGGHMVSLFSFLNRRVDQKLPQNFIFSLNFSHIFVRFLCVYSLYSFPLLLPCRVLAPFPSLSFFSPSTLSLIASPTSTSLWSLCYFTLSGASANQSRAHGTKNVREKWNKNCSSLPQDSEIADVYLTCLTAVQRGIHVREACENLQHCRISLSLSHRLHGDINVSEPTLVRSPQKPCIFSGPDPGGALSENEMLKKQRWIMQKRSCWCHPAALRRKHSIFLIEPPAAPTSHAGPAYQDLRAKSSSQ